MLEWWSSNWGNVASVGGLILSIPSLFVSYLSWQAASSAKAIVSKWHQRRRLESLRDSLQRAAILTQSLRELRSAKRWPVLKRLQIRDELAIVYTQERWPDELTSRFKPILAELRRDIQVGPASKAYLEVMLDLIRDCNVDLAGKLEEQT